MSPVDPLAVLARTPPWVLVLLAVLVGLGVQALRPRVVGLGRALATPLVFVGWSVLSLALRLELAPALGWCAGLAAGVALGLATVRLDGVAVEPGGIRLPGSRGPLARNLAIFGMRYGLAVALALAPAWREPLVFWDLAVSGGAAGWFVAWLLRFAALYRAAVPVLP